MKRHCSGREQPKNNGRLLTGTRTSRWGELHMLHKRTSHRLDAAKRSPRNVQQLYMSICSVLIELDRSQDYRDADAIKSHHQALHSGVKWFEEAATQEAQAGKRMGPQCDQGLDSGGG
jgi:hypothetical protein